MRQKAARGLISLALGAGLYAAAAPGAHATIYEFTLTGLFNATGTGNPDSISTTAVGPGTAFDPNTSFVMTATFDTAGGSAAPPIPGFVAYTPTSVTLTVAGLTYTVDPYTGATPGGVDVAIFDSTTIFGPGHYAAGFIQNPVADGAGIVGDWTTAIPDFVASSLVPTVFPASAFFGVGIQSGVCTLGPPDNCQAHAVTPITMHRGGTDYWLFLGNYDLEAAGNGVPGIQTEHAFTAALVPEPASMAMIGTAILGLAATRRRSRRT